MSQQVETPVNLPSSIAPLQDVLDYKNEWIIHKFLESFDVSFEEAADLFQEMKKWLWVNATARVEEEAGAPDIELFIDGPMTLVDEMWHTFILFTRPYQAFCERFFGFYIHHAPTTKEEKENAQKEAAANREKYMEELEQSYEIQYAYIYDKLGEETLSKWYSDYSDRYTPEFINKIRRPYS